MEHFHAGAVKAVDYICHFVGYGKSLQHYLSQQVLDLTAICLCIDLRCNNRTWKLAIVPITHRQCNF